MISEIAKPIGQQLVNLAIQEVILLFIIIFLNKVMKKQKPNPRLGDLGPDGITALFSFICIVIFLMNLPTIGELIYLVYQ